VSDDKSSWLENALGFVADKVRDGVQSVENTASSAVQSVEDAGSAVVQKAEDTVQIVDQTASSVVQSVEDAGSAVIQKAEDTVQSIGDTAESVVQSVEDTASSVVRNVADTASGLYDKASDAASEFLKEMTDPYQFGGVQAPIVKQLEEAASGGQPVDPRPLSTAELADAKVIFGDSLDYSKIVVDGGAVASLGASRTIGNTVHLTPDLFVSGTSETTTEGKRILVHELTHVWQYQHQGWTYAPKALWAQAKAAIKGDRDGAYDWRPLINTPWEQWNPEAQAEAVEDYNRALHNVNDGKGSKADYDTLALLQEFVEKLVAGPAA